MNKPFQIYAHDILIEKLAEIEHDQWMKWSKSIAESENLSEDRIARWKECWKPYSELTEEMKEHDRVWARKMLDAAGIEYEL